LRRFNVQFESEEGDHKNGPGARVQESEKTAP
jgi:hypothetical protein